MNCRWRQIISERLPLTTPKLKLIQTKLPAAAHSKRAAQAATQLHLPFQMMFQP
jgi:hypothetical protein